MVERLIALSMRKRELYPLPMKRRADGRVSSDDPGFHVWMESGSLALQIETLYGRDAWEKPLQELEARLPLWPVDR